MCVSFICRIFFSAPYSPSTPTGGMSSVVIAVIVVVVLLLVIAVGIIIGIYFYLRSRKNKISEIEKPIISSSKS